MPHNRAEREQEVHDRYDFVVCGGEYSVFNGLLSVADAIITGGSFTYAYLKDEVKRFGIDLATAIAEAGIDPLSETFYFDKFIFKNWEQPFRGVVVPGVNKFVPYVAARKKSQPPARPPIPPHAPDQPTPRGLDPMSMDFQHKLAYSYAFIRNAKLLTQGEKIESWDDLVLLALGHDIEVMKGYIKDESDMVIAYVSGDPSPFNLANSQAYSKAARLISSNPPITPDEEPLEGHYNWAIHEPISVVVEQIKWEIATLKDTEHLNIE